MEPASGEPSVERTIAAGLPNSRAREASPAPSTLSAGSPAALRCPASASRQAPSAVPRPDAETGSDSTRKSNGRSAVARWIRQASAAGPVASSGSSSASSGTPPSVVPFATAYAASAPARCTTPASGAAGVSNAATAAADSSALDRSATGSSNSTPRERSSVRTGSAAASGTESAERSRPIRRAPSSASRRAAASATGVVPPVTRYPARARTTERVGGTASSGAGSGRSTSFPVCRACAMTANASRAAANGWTVTGSGPKPPSSKPRTTSSNSSASSSGRAWKVWSRSTANSARFAFRPPRPIGLSSWMSRLPSSTNRPPGASSPRPSRSASPVRELSTTSTPRPPVAAATSAAKSVERESVTSSTPSSSRRKLRFAGVPAVANTRAPQRRATASAARPTPPLAEWTSTVSPARSRARWPNPYTAVRKATGTAAACSSSSADGLGATRCSSVVV